MSQQYSRHHHSVHSVCIMKHENQLHGVKHILILSHQYHNQISIFKPHGYISLLIDNAAVHNITYQTYLLPSDQGSYMHGKQAIPMNTQHTVSIKY